MPYEGDYGKKPDEVQWIPEDYIDKPLNEEQYQSFLRGYHSDWEFRYEPLHIDGWHYMFRSGWYVKKFKYEKKEDGLYHITENYTSMKEDCRDILAESFCSGYYEPRIWTGKEAQEFYKLSKY